MFQTQKNLAELIAAHPAAVAAVAVAVMTATTALRPWPGHQQKLMKLFCFQNTKKGTIYLLDIFLFLLFIGFFSCNFRKRRH